MLEECKSAQERWGGVHRLIDNWLNERQSMIVLYCKLLRSKPLSDEEALPQTVSRFCQVMMDYCSAGHFEIYNQLLQEASQYDDGGIELAGSVVPKIDAITGQCVDFNDTYDQHCSLEQFCHFADELSSLGERLAERFELEDMLIERLHNAHRDLAAEA
jgi:regulator of sigma D